MNDRISSYLQLNNFPYICICIYVYMCAYVCVHTYIYTSHFLYPVKDLGALHILAILNSPAVIMVVQIHLRHSIFMSFGYISGNGMAESYSSSISNILRNLHVVLHLDVRHNTTSALTDAALRIAKSSFLQETVH